jgi:uncharacterized protein with von Willebrand factor type A (vWA) domain
MNKYDKKLESAYIDLVALGVELDNYADKLFNNGFDDEALEQREKLNKIEKALEILCEMVENKWGTKLTNEKK